VKEQDEPAKILSEIEDVLQDDDGDRAAEARKMLSDYLGDEDIGPSLRSFLEELTKLTLSARKAVRGVAGGLDGLLNVLSSEAPDKDREP
jgi:hypothetical protein